MLQTTTANLKMRLTKLVGLALLMLAGLSGCFPGCSGLQGLLAGKPAGGTKTAFTVPAATPTTQFHQLRLGDFSGCWSKNPGLDFPGPADLMLPPNLVLPAAGLAAASANEPLLPWQFVCRMALHPRAPCAA